MGWQGTINSDEMLVSARSLVRALQQSRKTTLPALTRSLLPPTPAPFSSHLRHFATETTPTSSLLDPQLGEAQKELDKGNANLELGNLKQAEEHYKNSFKIKQSAIGEPRLSRTLDQDTGRADTDESLRNSSIQPRSCLVRPLESSFSCVSRIPDPIPSLTFSYQTSNLPSAITSFQSALELLQPASPKSTPDSPSPLEKPKDAGSYLLLADTHQNLGSAHILSVPPRPDLALFHLQNALELRPDDGETCWNLAAVLEATGDWDEALVAYQRADDLGIERAKVNIRNVSLNY